MKYLSPDEFELFCQGIKQFNEREFFHCHETWESLWHKLSGEEKEVIQGLIQLAVAYHHHLAGNNLGALRLFKRGLKRLEIFEPMFLGLELSELCRLTRLNIGHLESTLNCDGQSLLIAVLPSPSPDSVKA